MSVLENEEVLDWDFYLENPPLKPAHIVEVIFEKRELAMNDVCVTISYCCSGISVKLVSANEISFLVGEVTNANLSEVMKAICNVIPHIIDLDSDLAKCSDNGWAKSSLKAVDYIKVKRFAEKFPGTAKALGYLVNY